MACAPMMLRCAVLFCCVYAVSTEDAEVVRSLRRVLREQDASIRTTRRLTTAGPQTPAAEAPPLEDSSRRLQTLSAGTSVALCGSGECLVELTTGLAAWRGADPTRTDPHWAQVTSGSWIGESNPDIAPSLLVASASFRVNEPGCASFDLSIAADGRLRSATLNGHALTIPSHSHRSTTSQSGTPGLIAGRGLNLFAYGSNSLVLTVANDAGALGLYVSGSVQLLCPLDEATISMRPAQGPADGERVAADDPPLEGLPGTMETSRTHLSLVVEQ